MDAAGILNLYTQWTDKEAADDRYRADKNKGMLRGGSVGCLGAGGIVYGTCPRIALARMWGWNDTLPPTRKLMTDGGKGNELLWDKRFEAILGPVNYLPEGAVNVSWETTNGIQVSGTPDGTILNADGTKTGIEHKRISSAWTARTVSVKRKPKKTHLIQACHYMIAGGFSNYILLYTQDVDFPCPGVGGMDSTALWPESSAIVEYQNGYPFRIQPHVSVYDISVNEMGVFGFKHHTESQWTVSNVTVEGIKSFYEMVSRQEAQDVLGRSPSKKSPTGDKDDNASACSMCTLKSVCANKALRLSEFKADIMERIANDH